jgi:TusA-related sulfurtransferase
MATLAVDCGTLSCPGPLVQISKAIRTMKPGETLEVSARDPAFCEDVKAWCELTGNHVESLDREDGRCVAIIRKA